MPKPARKKKPDLPPYVVLKKGGTEWHIRISKPGQVRDRKGRKIYKQYTRKVDPQTEEQAALVLQALEAESKAELTGPIEANSLTDFLERYLTAKQRTVSARTWRDYDEILTRYVRGSKFGAMDLSEIRPKDVQQYYDGLSARGTSPAMVRKVHAVLRMAFRRAVLWEEMNKNPAEDVMLPRVSRHQSPAFDRKQARKFIETCRSNDDFIILEFALETGMRPQEYLALRWDHVDLSRRTIKIDQAITEKEGGGFEIGETKTPGSERTITFSKQLKNRLLRQKEIIETRIQELKDAIARPLLKQGKAQGYNYWKRGRRRMTARAIIASYEKYGLVFPASNGMPIARNNLNRREMVDAMDLAKLKIAEFSIRNLRHSSATLLIASGANLKYVSRRLGHANVTMTLNKYQNVIPEMDKAAHDIIEDLLY